MLLAYTGVVFKTLPDEKLYGYRPTRFVSLSKVRYGSILTSLQVIVQVHTVLPRLELTAPNINAVSDLIICCTQTFQDTLLLRNTCKDNCIDVIMSCYQAAKSIRLKSTACFIIKGILGMTTSMYLQRCHKVSRLLFRALSLW